MKSNIIEEVLQKKKYYEEEEQQLNRKKETLEESKKILKSESIDTQSIDIAIKSYKEKIEKVKESKKKIAAILKTMKSSKTKIKNRVNKIVRINDEIATIKENIEKLKIQNNNDKTNEEFNIWNKELEEKTKKLMHEYKIIQGARTAKERAIRRYEALLNGTSYIISKKETKCRAKKTEKYKAVLELETIEKAKIEVAEEVKPEIIEKSEPEVAEEVKPEIIEKSEPEVVEKAKTEVIEKVEQEVVGEKNEAIKITKDEIKDISYITLYESTGKIEIDGKIKNIDRHAYIDIEEEIIKICKEVLNISRKSEQKRVMSKIDYAIVNGIKETIMFGRNRYI